VGCWINKNIRSNWTNKKTIHVIENGGRLMIDLKMNEWTVDPFCRNHDEK